MPSLCLSRSLVKRFFDRAYNPRERVSFLYALSFPSVFPSEQHQHTPSRSKSTLSPKATQKELCPEKQERHRENARALFHTLFIKQSQRHDLKGTATKRTNFDSPSEQLLRVVERRRKKAVVSAQSPLPHRFQQILRHQNVTGNYCRDCQINCCCV